MGVYFSSITLTPEEIEELSQNTLFSPQQVRQLYKRFSFLDKNSQGYIKTKDIMMIPEFATNPVSSRLLVLFEGEKGSGGGGSGGSGGSSGGMINFKKFLSVLSPFGKNASLDDKYRLVFSLYDLNSDGYIDADDLCGFLKLLVGSNLSEQELLQVARDCIQVSDEDHDGKLSLQEFKKSCPSVAELNIL
jgi:serine/threonine-protein phosphatase 2B regulatory subunit